MFIDITNVFCVNFEHAHRLNKGVFSIMSNIRDRAFCKKGISFSAINYFQEKLLQLILTNV